MFRVDKGRDPTVPLGVGRHMQRERRLAARLGPVDLRDAAARDSTYPDGGVEVDGPGGNGVHLGPRVLAHAHDRSLAAGLFDLRDGEVQRFPSII